MRNQKLYGKSIRKTALIDCVAALNKALMIGLGILTEFLTILNTSRLTLRATMALLIVVPDDHSHGKACRLPR